MLDAGLAADDVCATALDAAVACVGFGPGNKLRAAWAGVDPGWSAASRGGGA
jgi:hypothetical protein